MKKISLLLVAIAFLLPPQAMGCTIPVFRYALENWELTRYEILVFQRGPLPNDLHRQLEKFNANPNKANVEVTYFDLDNETVSNENNNLLNTWHCEGKPDQTPWMLVRNRGPDETLATAWSGPCTIANLQCVLDSPKRQAILAQLRAGASGVFVLLSSSDRAADQAAYAMAYKELQKLQQKIKLGEQSKDGPQIRLPLPLRVSLPLLKLDRHDPAEAALVSLLLATESDLDKVKGPILFPIFGRGRVFPSMYGENLDREFLGKTSEFLCRDCACLIKELNPGVDLLVTIDWKATFDKLFEDNETAAKVKAKADTQNEEVPGLTFVTPTSMTPAPRPLSFEDAVVNEPESDCMFCRNWLWIAIAVASVLVVATGVWAAYSSRK